MTKHRDGHGTTPTTPWAHPPRRTLPVREASSCLGLRQKAVAQDKRMRANQDKGMRVDQEKKRRSLKVFNHLPTSLLMISLLRVNFLLHTTSLTILRPLPLAAPIPLLEAAVTTPEASRYHPVLLPSPRLYLSTRSTSSQRSLQHDHRLNTPRVSHLRSQSLIVSLQALYELRYP